MEKILIFGHKNPDTDSICSSLVMEELEKRFGNDKAEAVALGKVNKETEFVLNYFKIDAPRVISEVEDGQEVILVDHNEFNQSVNGIENAKILKVMDHHRINNFCTKEPLFYFAQPVGCTATLLYEVFAMNNYEVDEKLAGLMLSAIISDTLLLKSPTCTVKDIEVANKLAEIAKIDINSYGLEMLKAGTDLNEYSADELINLDAKSLDKNGTKFVIAQVNTVSIDDVLTRQEEIENAIKNEIAKNGLELFVFAITDILNCNSEIIAIGNKVNSVEKAFDVTLEKNRAFLEGVVSRKKQLLPKIDENI